MIGWKTEMIDKIEEYLDELYPNPKCELNYNKDYELLIAVMLSAQTTDKRVNGVTEILFKKYDTLEKLANAKIEDLKNIIRPIGTFNKKSIFIKEIASYLIKNFNGVVPSERKELEKIPGVGRKTANVIASVVYDKPAMAVDTHVFRVSNRIGLTVNSKTPLETEKELTKHIPKSLIPIAHHWLILHGRYVCTARNPKCESCGLKPWCNYFLHQK